MDKRTLTQPKADRRIVVRGVNWLGDAVMSTPALARLREAAPHASITLLTPEKLADLWQSHPAIDSVLTFGANQSLASVARTLRQQHFDLALILPNSFRSAAECWWAGIPTRIGYAGQWRRWLLTKAVAERVGAVRMRKRSVAEIQGLRQISPTNEGLQGAEHSHAFARKELGTSPTAHHVHQYLHLTAAIGANPLPVRPMLSVSKEEVAAFRTRQGLSEDMSRPLFGLNPGAEYGPAKRWPADRYVAAAAEIQKRCGCQWLLFGGKQDQALAASIIDGLSKLNGAKENRPLNLAGATSLRELCAGLKACDLLLTNDTGPMHVAAAVGTPVVVPFGSTSPELTGPGLPGDPQDSILRVKVPCAPCFRRECPVDFACMIRIEPEDVIDAVLAVPRKRRN